MSTTTEPISENRIPGSDEITVASGGKAWRFANGKIVRGQETEADSGVYAEEKTMLVGRLVRVGIYHGKPKNGLGFDYDQVEADIETRDGVMHVKSGLTDPETGLLKPSVATLNFAWGLTQVKKGDVISISCARGEPVTLPSGRKGGRPTYVNFALVDAKNTAHPIYKPKRNPAEPKLNAAQQWDILEPKIRAHEAFAERPDRDDEDDAPATHLAALKQEMIEKAWPSPDDGPTEWLQLMNAFHESAKKGRLQDFDDHEWGLMRQALATKPADKMPKILAPAKVRLDQRRAQEAQQLETTAKQVFKVDPLATEEEAYDPFADE